MLESLIEEFAGGLYTQIDREDTGSGGSFGGAGWRRRVDGNVLMIILENAVLDGRRAMLPTVIPACNVRDLISAAEAFAVFKTAVARAREAEEQS